MSKKEKIGKIRKTSCHVILALHEGIAADSSAWNLQSVQSLASMCRNGTYLHNLHSLVNHPDSLGVWCILTCPFQRRSSGSTPPPGPSVLQ